MTAPRRLGAYYPDSDSWPPLLHKRLFDVNRRFSNVRAPILMPYEVVPSRLLSS